jgi:hypothetical protein
VIELFTGRLAVSSLGLHNMEEKMQVNTGLRFEM